MNALFFSRLFLYLAAVSIPLFHPAVAVSYDRLTLIAYMILVPLFMAFAFYIRRPRVSAGAEIWVPLITLGFIVPIASGATLDFWLPIGAAAYSYLSTRTVFSASGRGPSFAVLELFLLAGVYYKILDFTRSSEEIAAASAAWTPALFIFSIAAFLIHSSILYLASFPDRTAQKKRREIALFTAALFLIGLPIALLIPKDFIKHDIVFNDLNEEPPPRPRPLDTDGSEQGMGMEPSPETRNGKPLGERPEKYPSELQGGGGREGGSQQRPEGEGDGRSDNSGGGGESQKRGESQGKEQKGPRLEGVPADQWEKQEDTGDSRGKGGKGGKQRALMIVASKINPVYAAERYLGSFDPEMGFTLSEREKLNRLASLRLLDTWKNLEKLDDAMRNPVDIYFLSTIQSRAVAYLPLSIEPTVLDKRYHPFDLSYTSVSGVSLSSPEQWAEIGGLSYEENERLGDYLELSLDEKSRAVLKRHLEKAIRGKDGYFARIHAILKSFERYQYEMGFDDSITVPKIVKFLNEGKSGDCSEFASTAAALARMAGIPSRVVEGYIASRDLQTPAHRGGLRVLRRKIPALQKFPVNDLYLVTTSHHHAWVQYYMPGYGWVDFETTSYAIPPKMEMDPNAMDVVIPMIEESPVPPEEKKFIFPWRLFLAGTALLIASLFTGLYGFRYGKEFLLLIKSKRDTKEGLDAIMTLLLMRLAANGYPLKEPYRTPIEYAKESEAVGRFADLYTMLRFRARYGPGEREARWAELRSSYREVVTATRRPGICSPLQRLFSLRGLYY
jgi:hypothetical protein